MDNLKQGCQSVIGFRWTDWGVQGLGSRRVGFGLFGQDWAVTGLQGKS